MCNAYDDEFVEDSNSLVGGINNGAGDNNGALDDNDGGGSGSSSGEEVYDFDYDMESSGDDVTEDAMFDEEEDSEQTEHCDYESNGSLLRFILTIFFRIVYHFNISNNAASKILTFISFLLGMSMYPRIDDYF